MCLNTKQELNELFKDCNLSMQECAIDFLKKQKDIDFILVGMRKPIYVSELLG